MQKHYSWVRYWAEAPSVVEGFLPTPRQPFAPEQTWQTLSELQDKPLLILLAASGMGKSWEMRSEQCRLDGLGASTHFMRLADYQNKAGFDAEISSLHDGTVLFLDALDECRIKWASAVRQITQSIQAMLQSKPQVKLRMSCRDADWDAKWTQDLGALFNEKKPDWYLLPLQAEDAQAAAAQNGLDGPAFSQAVQNARADLFARQPNLLELLLAQYQPSRGLPNNRVELFKQGCLALCNEPADRKENRTAGQFTQEQRYSILARLAVYMVLTNQLRFLMEQPLVKNGDAVMALSAVWPDLRHDDLNELRRCGLLVADGDNALRFQHESFVEFMAADDLHRCGLPEDRLLNLLTLPGREVIAPQLAPVAAWLAVLNDALWPKLVQRIPKTLFRLLPSHLPDAKKQMLVAGLLRCTERGESLIWGIHPELQAMNHAGLAAQLRPYLQRDANKNPQTVLLALELVDANALKPLADLALEWALDTSQDETIRRIAADALGTTANHEQLLQLKPLLHSLTEQDPNDNLRGVALRLLWKSQLITVEELFESLKADSNQSHYGHYQMFLHELVPQLQPAHLPAALGWCAHLATKHETAHSLQELKVAVCKQALASLDDTAVRVAFSQMAQIYFSNYQPLFGYQEAGESWLSQQPFEHRKRLIRTLLGLAANDTTASQIWALTDHKALAQCLFEPLAAYLPSEKKGLVKLAKLGFWHSSRISSALIELAQTQTEWRYWLRRSLRPHQAATKSQWVLASRLVRRPIAAERSSYLQDQETRAERRRNSQRQQLPEGTRAIRVMHWLQEHQSGSADAFPQLLSALCLDESRRGYSWSYTIDDTLGWADADEQIREAILDAGQDWLSQRGVSQLFEARQASRFTGPDMAAAAALLALHSHRPGFNNDLPPQRWAHWGPMIVLTELFQPNSSLLEVCLPKVNAAAPNLFWELIAAQHAARAKESPVHGYRVPSCIEVFLGGAPLHDQVLSLALDAQTQPSSCRNLLEQLLAHAASGAWVLLQPRLASLPDHLQATVWAFLLWYSPAMAWQPAQVLMHDDAAFRKAVFDELGAHSDSFGIAPHRPILGLPSAAVGQLLSWVVERQPLSEDIDLNGMVLPIHKLIDIRRGFLDALIKRSDAEAIAFLTAFHQAHPEFSYLPTQLADMQVRQHDSQWLPLSPEQLQQLLAHPEKRVIRSEDELLDVVMECLDVAQQRLQGANPQARLLWDCRRQPCQPKTEADLGSWIEDHLNTHLVNKKLVINGEVSVRQNPSGKGRPLSVDLLVTHIPTGESPLILTIELKGSWNDELLTALESQLCADYLRPFNRRVGIYLAGWFGVKETKPQRNLDDLRQQLELQAQQQSDKGDVLVRALVLDVSLPA